MKIENLSTTAATTISTRYILIPVIYFTRAVLEQYDNPLVIAIDLARFPVSSGSLNAIQLRLAPIANATRKQKQKRQEEERITKTKQQERRARARTKTNGAGERVKRKHTKELRSRIPSGSLCYTQQTIRKHSHNLIILSHLTEIKSNKIKKCDVRICEKALVLPELPLGYFDSAAIFLKGFSKAVNPNCKNGQ